MGRRQTHKVLKDNGVDFQHVWDVFDDPIAIDIEDFGHSTDDEIRYIIIGKTAAYGLVSVSYTIAENQYRLLGEPKNG